MRAPRTAGLRAFALTGLALAPAVVGGCKRGPTAAELRGAQYVIRKVEFEGVTRFDERELHDYLELRPTSWNPLPERHWFYEGLIPIDEQRIEELYAAHGYYEAQVVDVRVEYIDRKTRSKVDLTFVIEEGPVTHVDEVVVRWPEGAPDTPPKSKRRRPFVKPPDTDPHAVSQEVELATGDPFEIPAMQASRDALRLTLRRAGHPFASVEPEAEVNRELREADVDFEVRAGPFMNIGEVEIEGLETVPEKAVRVEMEFAEGQAYSPELLTRMEQKVYGLGVFSTVTVLPEKQDEDGDGELDLTVKLREADPQRVRLGVGLGFEPNRWNQHLSARYSHDNLWHALYKMSVTARAGYAELPNLINPIEHGPIAGLDIHGEKKGLLEKHLVWTLDPRLELGVEQGYQYWAAKHRFGLSRFFTRWFELELSHSLRYVDFFSVSPTLSSDETILGLDFRDPYVLSYVGVDATIYAVDRITDPNDGVELGANYKIAGGPFGGDFDYQEISPFLRAYWRPINRLQFALRGRVGMIFPYGKDPGAPIDLRRYLGGSNTVRGWGLRRLSPKISDCEPGQDYRRDECESIPVGGNSSVLGSFEIRVRTWRELWAAAFVDMGDVREGVAAFEPREWNYSSGAGLRYASPIGTFRIDVGFRLNDTPLSQGEPIWALHFGLGESF